MRLGRWLGYAALAVLLAIMLLFGAQLNAAYGLTVLLFAFGILAAMPEVRRRVGVHVFGQGGGARVAIAAAALFWIGAVAAVPGSGASFFITLLPLAFLAAGTRRLTELIPAQVRGPLIATAYALLLVGLLAAAGLIVWKSGERVAWDRTVLLSGPYLTAVFHDFIAQSVLVFGGIGTMLYAGWALGAPLADADQSRPDARMAGADEIAERSFRG